MAKHKRYCVYVYDHQDSLIWTNEDDKPIDEIYEELEEFVSDCTGNFVKIEIPAEAKGKGKRGGDNFDIERKKFVFKVKIGSGAARSESMSAGGGSLAMMMSLMREQGELRAQLEKERSERVLDEIRRDMKDLRKNKDDSPVEQLAGVIWNKYAEAERVKGIAREVTAPKAKAAEPAGTIADEVNPDKEKLKGAIRNFQEVDENFIENMDFLSRYAKENPSIYKAFIDNLKKKPE